MSDLGPTPDLARVRGLRDDFIAVVDEITAARDETSARAPIARLRRLLDEAIAVVDEIIVERGLTANALADEANEEDVWLDPATISERYNVPADTVRSRCRNKGLGKKIRGRWWMTPREVEQWQSG
jgi:hypothetical protein